MTDAGRNIELLFASESIRNTIALYGIGADNFNDPEILGPLFTDDAIWSCKGFGAFKGRRDIEKGLSEIAKTRVLWSFHVMANPHIKVSSDKRSAQANWALWELSSYREESSQSRDSIMAGFYRAQFQKIDDSWLICKMELEIIVNSPYPAGFK